MSGRPFINVPWNRPFLPALLDIALRMTDGDVGSACFVFPHVRPALYMTDIIRNDGRIAKPCILPRMVPVSRLFSLIRSTADHGRVTAGMPVGMLDQVALLLGVVRELREERGGLLRDLPLSDSRRFFPWGIRLANLMEEFLVHNSEPEDYIHMQNQVTPFAAALLENLGSLHARYLAAMEERGWTTPGLDAATVVNALKRGVDLTDMPELRHKRVFLAGFHTLTGSQRILFRHLWERMDATVCLHADENIVKGVPHWSCTDFVRWAGSWQTAILPYDDGSEAPSPPEVMFRAGYDVHSQINELARELTEQRDLAKRPKSGKSYSTGQETRTPGATAVILPDTSLLLPVLHHLPDADRNISMGYPLARSPLFRLVEIILSLQETRRGTRPHGYYWKDSIALLRHPYLKMLVPYMEEPASGSAADVPNAAAQTFRRLLQYAERIVRTSRRFSRLTDLVAQSVETYAQNENAVLGDSAEALFRRILDVTVFQWENVTTPDALAVALQNIVELMRAHGGALWEHFPIDAECLYRLTESLIPQLAHTALKEENLPPETLFTVLRGLMAEERVPFEAYPLVGEQILGVLETRLLHFDRVYLLDATEDRLPGTGGHDPLLPESLRPLAGLPGAHGREKVAAYNFFRLIHGARTVVVYWQEGVTAQGLSDAKKMRSRFVEELLWNEEVKREKILRPELPENAGADGPLRIVSCILPPVPHERAAIPVTGHIAERMRALLQTELSPSLLDSYLRCPARFFYERIGRIREVESVTEGRDPMGTGVFLHNVLRRYCAERLDTPLRADKAACDAISETFRNELSNSELCHTLPPDDRIMLEEAAPVILRTLLENHAGRIPRHVETKFRAELTVDGQTRVLAGVIDRVDEEAAGLLVLDYKTGHVPLVSPKVWQDDEFWDRLASWLPETDPDILDAVANAFGSLQLPAYIHILGGRSGLAVHDAAYIPLRMGAKDSFLFGGKTAADERSRAVSERIPLLFTFLLRHMEKTTMLKPRPSQNCDWCLYRNICIVFARQGISSCRQERFL